MKECKATKNKLTITCSVLFQIFNFCTNTWN